jgi:hypothetical protein
LVPSNAFLPISTTPIQSISLGIIKLFKHSSDCSQENHVIFTPQKLEDPVVNTQYISTKLGYIVISPVIIIGKFISIA